MRMRALYFLGSLPTTLQPLSSLVIPAILSYQPVCPRHFHGSGSRHGDGDGKIHLGATSSEVEELIENNLDKSYRRKEESPFQVLTTRREALSLYRDILRWSLLFVWKDEKGKQWKDNIRESARKEFEEARFETDPEIINRLLVSGRDCVQQVKDKFMSQRQRIIEDEAQRRGPDRSG